MRKVFRLQDLCCANCAAQIQDRISRLDGVNQVSVNFLTQKFTLDAQDDSFQTVLSQSEKIFAKIEPDCTILK